MNLSHRLQRLERTADRQVRTTRTPNPHPVTLEFHRLLSEALRRRDQSRWRGEPDLVGLTNAELRQRMDEECAREREAAERQQ